MAPDGKTKPEGGAARGDVLCAGYACWDLIFEVGHHPGPDEKCFASALFSSGGGPAANAAVTVARLGGAAAFAGYLGGDFYGGRHLSELRAEGVIPFVLQGSSPTPLSVILVKPGGARTVISHRGETPAVLPGSLDFSKLEPAVMLFDGHEPALSSFLAQRARKERIPVVLDAGSVHAGTVELAPAADYLLTSEKFARDFTGESDPAAAAGKLAQIAPFVAVTLGAKGLVWRAGAEAGALPAVPVDAVDTTGAGDIFHGAFALEIARGANPLAALDLAGAAAALGCTKIGARQGIPTREELDRFLAGGRGEMRLT
jgi:sulfofructose kinase